MLRAIIALLSLMLLTSGAEAQKRVALVIGNSAYQHAGTLTNPKNDASDVAAALKNLSFQVVYGSDLDKAAFDRKIRDFAAALQGAEAGLFFYAGHGLQVSGRNYLVPTDAELTTAAALEFEMVQLDTIHRIMESQSNTNLLFLDACRNNPLARNLSRAMGTRSAEIGRGLAAVESGVGTLISFSTQPGNVALDGTGRNSPFAAALVKQLADPRDDLGAILIAVRNDVMKETQRQQVPWEHSALTGRFFFKAPTVQPSANISAPGQPQLQVSEAERAWPLVKDTTNTTVLEAFATRYKDTFFADLARGRIEDLKKRQALTSTPPERIEDKARPDTTALAKYKFSIRKDVQALSVNTYYRGFEDLENCQKRCANDARCNGFELFGQCRLFSDTPKAIVRADGWTVGIKIKE